MRISPLFRAMFADRSISPRSRFPTGLNGMLCGTMTRIFTVPRVRIDLFNGGKVSRRARYNDTCAGGWRDNVGIMSLNGATTGTAVSVTFRAKRSRF